MKFFLAIILAFHILLVAKAENKEVERVNKAGEYVVLGNETYYFSPRLELGVSSIEATRVCNDLGMKLISFENEEKWILFQDYMNFAGWSNSYFWTSARRYDDSWIWTGTGQEIKYFSWGENQPTNMADSDCIIAMSIAQWWDAKCIGWCNYICEY